MTNQAKGPIILLHFRRELCSLYDILDFSIVGSVRLPLWNGYLNFEMTGS